MRGAVGVFGATDILSLHPASPSSWAAVIVVALVAALHQARPLYVLGRWRTFALRDLPLVSGDRLTDPYHWHFMQGRYVEPLLIGALLDGARGGTLRYDSLVLIATCCGGRCCWAFSSSCRAGRGSTPPATMPSGTAGRSFPGGS